MAIFDMKSWIGVLFILAVIVSVEALHVDHLAEEDDKYKEILENEQADLQKGVAKLNESLKSTTEALDAETNMEKRISLLEQAILDQQNQIYLLSTRLIEPLNLSKEACQNISDSKKQEISQNAQANIRKIETLNADIQNTQLSSVQKEQLRVDLKSQVFYLRNIKLILDTNCSNEIVLSPTIFQTNLKSKQWVLGNQTMGAVVDQYYKRTQLYQNVTNCPITHPFWNGTRCINCTDPELPLFNIQTQRCSNCNDTQQFDAQQKRCVGKEVPIKPNATNPAALDKVTPPVTPVTPEEGAVYCPTDKPFFNGTGCMNCQGEKNLFNSTTKECTGCPSGQLFNSTTKLCVVPETPPNATNPSAYNRVTPALVPGDQPMAYCPENQPFYNGTACINCEGELEIFNTSTNSCTKCPETLTFLAAENKCVKATNYTNIKSRWSSTDKEAAITQIKEEAKNPLSKECPLDLPFFDGSKCKNCDPEEYFDLDAKECKKCADDETFHVFKKQCLSNTPEFITNPNSPNLIYGEVPKGEWDYFYQNNKTTHPEIKDCPSDTPHFDGTECTNCENPKHFNLLFLECQECSEGTKYENNECIDEQGNAVAQTPSLEKLAGTVFVHHRSTLSAN